MILQQMNEALAITCVKYMGLDRPVPDLEFVMHPNKKADAVLESHINNPYMIMHEDGSWTFRGVPVREDASVSNWTLCPVQGEVKP